MILGITKSTQEINRVSVLKKLRVVTICFIITILFPFISYLIFHFDIVSGKAAYDSDIQEPVAKIVTNNGVGTAFLITPTLLLTARHILENSNINDEVDLFFEQSKNKLNVKGKIKYIVPTSIQPNTGQVPMDYFLTDVAVLEVSEITEIEPLQLGESEAVSNLDEVILIGYPIGDYSISKGNINSDKFQGLNLFKLDATSNPGNSGGPCILKSDKTVIGILVGGRASQYQGENVALKIDDVKRILDNSKIIY